VEAAARDLGARATRVVDDNDEERAVYGSTWMLLDRRIGPPPTLEDASPPQTAEESEEKTVPTWTDDYSNLIGILK
jgi:hypothetical protein